MYRNQPFSLQKQKAFTDSPNSSRFLRIATPLFLKSCRKTLIKQKKTGGQEYLDINKQAEEYLGKQSKADERVFAGFSYNSQTLLELKRWCMLAGITKDVTFHSGRHTFAVVMLDLGADIYTVSKLLGHKELSTTQIYAKVLDKKKQEAVNLIPDINI